MKLVKKYVFFVPLLLAVLLTNSLNAAAAIPAEFKFDLENKTPNLYLWVWVGDKDGNDILWETILPGATFSKEIEIADAATSEYSIVAGTANEKSLWKIVKAADKMNINKKVTDATTTTNPDVRGLKNKLAGVKASFEVKFDAANEKGSFTAILDKI